MTADLFSQAMLAFLIIGSLLVPVGWTALAHWRRRFGLVWCSLPLQYLGIIVFEIVAFALIPSRLLRRSQPDMVGDTLIPATTILPDLIFASTWIAAPAAVLLAFRKLTFHLPRG